jgi:hypothetical protein
MIKLTKNSASWDEEDIVSTERDCIRCGTKQTFKVLDVTPEQEESIKGTLLEGLFTEGFLCNACFKKEYGER